MESTCDRELNKQKFAPEKHIASNKTYQFPSTFTNRNSHSSSPVWKGTNERIIEVVALVYRTDGFQIEINPIINYENLTKS